MEAFLCLMSDRSRAGAHGSNDYILEDGTILFGTWSISLGSWSVSLNFTLKFGVLSYYLSSIDFTDALYKDDGLKMLICLFLFGSAHEKRRRSTCWEVAFSGLITKYRLSSTSASKSLTLISLGSRLFSNRCVLMTSTISISFWRVLRALRSAAFFFEPQRQTQPKKS